MPFLLLAAVTLANGVIGEELKVTSIDEFITFKNNVNGGTNYSGTTVFLDSDIDLSGKTFEPIGNETHYFNGVFDGQGYAISNLKMNSSSEYAGLFGYSGGLTIKNVILDSSCSITSSFSGDDDAYVGGIIGYCNSACIIENSVNMVNVTFDGDISSSLYLGGIVGYLYPPRYNSTVKNCANYGDIIHSGTSSTSYIGGLAGFSKGSSQVKKVYIYNSLNHGTITHRGTTSNSLHFGGIAGSTQHTTIGNCVSGRNVSMLTTASGHAGSIVGSTSSTIIKYCYSTSNLSRGNYGDGSPSSTSYVLKYNSTTFQLNETVSIGNYTGISLIDALNAYADNHTLSNYSHWLFNKEKNDVTFTINENSTFALKSQVILLPDPADGWRGFVGWFEDSSLTNAFSSSSVSTKTELYGKWDKYTVYFDGNGGSAAATSITVTHNGKYGDLPEPTRTGYTFVGWFTEVEGGEEVKSGDIVKITEDKTLYAHWSINKYTITFSVDGGSECESITQDYNTEIVLPEPTKTGYTFDCWCSDPELSNEYAKATIPARNMTLYAKWIINQYNLTFIFNNGAENEVRTLDFNEKIVYPENVKKTGYTFSVWDNKPDRMPAENLTVTAQWIPNNYTVTFNLNGGGTSQSTKIVTFESVYGELSTPNRTGHTFLGWFTEKNESITSESIVSIPDNHTLCAHWLKPTPSQVEIVFSTKDIAKEEIEKIIKQNTGADFNIIIIEFSRGDEKGMRAIVDFADPEEAKNFIETVEGSSETKAVIRNVDFVVGSAASFSPEYHLLNFLFLI